MVRSELRKACGGQLWSTAVTVPAEAPLEGRRCRVLPVELACYRRPAWAARVSSPSCSPLPPVLGAVSRGGSLQLISTVLAHRNSHGHGRLGSWPRGLTAHLP